MTWLSKCKELDDMIEITEVIEDPDIESARVIFTVKDEKKWEKFLEKCKEENKTPEQKIIELIYNAFGISVKTKPCNVECYR